MPDARDADTVLAAMPGCLLAVGPIDTRSCLVVGPAGTAIRFTATAPLGRVCASVVHAWLTEGRDLAELPGEFSVALGAATHVVTATGVTEGGQPPPHALGVPDETACPACTTTSARPPNSFRTPGSSSPTRCLPC